MLTRDDGWLSFSFFRYRYSADLEPSNPIFRSSRRIRLPRNFFSKSISLICSSNGTMSGLTCCFFREYFGGLSEASALATVFRDTPSSRAMARRLRPCACRYRIVVHASTDITLPVTSDLRSISRPEGISLEGWLNFQREKWIGFKWEFAEYFENAEYRLDKFHLRKAIGRRWAMTRKGTRKRAKRFSKEISSV